MAKPTVKRPREKNADLLKGEETETRCGSGLRRLDQKRNRKREKYTKRSTKGPNAKKKPSRFVGDLEKGDSGK